MTAPDSQYQRHLRRASPQRPPVPPVLPVSRGVWQVLRSLPYDMIPCSTPQTIAQIPHPLYLSDSHICPLRRVSGRRQGPSHRASSVSALCPSYSSNSPLKPGDCRLRSWRPAQHSAESVSSEAPIQPL